ncbi:lipid A deacylase LpxR family protein [Hymenobacter sediminicola]|uniref:Lipid A deacylase LpxR family protein n=1 Tax=Hymenobacter sediminicola TaxID=2761579 RepID=A0A7G7W717_9BACT|nr:lipid A deacylase LpxR family protein [Hymenobacter sediminicola]QNH62160.1 lipid A deacylase LpxR family protein [Hymenobacter sediminicola]
MRVFLLAALCLITGVACAQRLDSAQTSPDRLVYYTFANDAFFRTDYYFTQGQTLTLVLPALRHSPVNRILGPVPTGSIRYHGIRLRYDGFTPLRIQDPFIRVGDRPYASYWYADFFRVANQPTRKFRLTTALNLGFMGPAAGAKGFQTKLHEWLDAPTPRGWDYQIRNDLVLGYAARAEKQLLAVGRGAELIGSADASLGTLYTYAGAGARLRVGLLNPYFDNLGVSGPASRAGQRRVQLYAEGQLEGRLVGYDATLQGGLFRSDNPYTLPANAISRTVARSTATLGLGYAGVRLEASAVQISPEFNGARSHKWVQFGVRVGF